jgi:Adenylosuccinate synthetase
MYSLTPFSPPHFTLIPPHAQTHTHIRTHAYTYTHTHTHTTGTTHKGIGPAYSSKTMRNGIRIGDLRDMVYFESRLRGLVKQLEGGSCTIHSLSLKTYIHAILSISLHLCHTYGESAFSVSYTYLSFSISISQTDSSLINNLCHSFVPFVLCFSLCTTLSTSISLVFPTPLSSSSSSSLSFSSSPYLPLLLLLLLLLHRRELPRLQNRC